MGILLLIIVVGIITLLYQLDKAGSKYGQGGRSHTFSSNAGYHDVDQGYTDTFGDCDNWEGHHHHHHHGGDSFGHHAGDSWGDGGDCGGGDGGGCDGGCGCD